MVFARSVAGVDFSTIDEQPVHMIFLMISSLFRIMSYEDMRKKLFASTTDEQFLEMIVRPCDLQGIEAYQPNVDVCRSKGIETHAVNIEREKLPYPDGHFDVVLANQVIESRFFESTYFTGKQ
ncbi:MAG: hypothetical protein MUF22_01405 [Chitinispirillaceae bacterium]|jgi:hypothetical protein|nr:hypothetical protein [Chitinispirillaceae bacterium]